VLSLVIYFFGIAYHWSVGTFMARLWVAVSILKKKTFSIYSAKTTSEVTQQGRKSKENPSSFVFCLTQFRKYLHEILYLQKKKQVNKLRISFLIPSVFVSRKRKSFCSFHWFFSFSVRNGITRATTVAKDNPKKNAGKRWKRNSIVSSYKQMQERGLTKSINRSWRNLIWSDE
jgi:hypothetical protein